MTGNLNCPLAVTRSACYFVVRCLTDPDVPASGGAFAPVRVTAPEGSLVNARPPAAVAAGNVETSSRIVDVVFAAFGQAVPVPAQGQGTMNNLTLGNDRFTYYETVGGGQGACPDADGPSGVHVAMSNTLSTPAEALELGYPLRVERHQLRLGSGGRGEHRGGDGVVRELRVLEPCRLSLVGERRLHAPHGARGGEPGAPGRDLLNGEELPGEGRRAHSSPATSSGSRRRAAAASDLSQRANRQARRIAVGPSERDVALSTRIAFHTCAPATPTVGRSRREVDDGARERTWDEEPGWRRWSPGSRLSVVLILPARRPTPCRRAGVPVAGRVVLLRPEHGLRLRRARDGRAHGVVRRVRASHRGCAARDA